MPPDQVRSLVGQEMGPYKILSLLGTGGMGEVYLAQDTSLDRKVALKFLPQEMQQDETARKRLLREAKASAALDHPYICQIHEVDQIDSRDFIAMEYVQGMTLEEKLREGPVPLKEALQTAAKIAEALEAAHKLQIVHRDLKPSNIMFTTGGYPKVMDFGVAKRLIPPEEMDSQGKLKLTETGVRVGTLPYMSPEQTRGERVDTRSDIFSFGVVLYEMLTGVQPFQKDSAVETSNAILKETPAPVTNYLDGTPIVLPHTVRKMLAKDPDRRYQHVSDVRIDLEELTSDAADSSFGVQPAGQEATTTPGWWRHPIPSVAIGLLILLMGVLLGFLLWNPDYDEQRSRPVTRFSIVLPDGETIPAAPSLALSPDGTQVVYAAARDDTQQLYLRATDQLEASPIPGTEGGWAPFFSPDGKWVGFFTDPKRATGELKKVSLLGGDPLTICEVGVGRGGSWGENDRIIFGKWDGLWRVSSSGGTPEPLIEEGRIKWPQILPGGREVLFQIDQETPSIGVLSLDTGQQRILVDRCTKGRYVSTGHLLCAQGSSLLAAPFDLDSLEVQGPAVPVLDDVWMAAWGAVPIAESGALAYVSGLPDPEDGLVWVDRRGVEESFVETQMQLFQPRLSPDGKRLAITGIKEGRQQAIWTCEIERCLLTPVTTLSAQSPVWSRPPQSPVWSRPNGTRLFFAQKTVGGRDIWWIPTDGRGQAEQLFERGHAQIPGACSPDGKVLAFSERDEGGDFDLFTLQLDGGSKPEPFHATQFHELRPVFSPDGLWIAFTSNRSGSFNVYVKRYPAKGLSIPISTDGGSFPRWAPDGKEIFFRDGEHTMEHMMAVSVQRQPSFRVGKPRVFTSGSYRGDYDIAPDGRRFLMIKASTQESATQIHVVLNWIEELKRLVPTDR